MTPRASFWRRYFLAGVVFQSVLIGGGYATGRELVEYFLASRPAAAFTGLLLVAAIWSVICAAAFAHAHAARTYDYRTFYRSLLGRGWVLYEIAYIALMVLVLAVLGAAAGEIGSQFLGVTPAVGTAVFALLVAVVCALGLRVVELAFSVWGPLIYPVFGVLAWLAITQWPGTIGTALATPAQPGNEWVMKGLAYAGYNLAVIASVLPFARHFTTTREAVVSGLLCGPLAIIPGMLLITALLTQYPEIVGAPVPVTVVLTGLELPWLTLMVSCVIFGTLVQTGFGIIGGLVERLVQTEGVVQRFPERWLRAVVPVVLVVVSVYLGERLGLIALIAQGYGTVAWVILLLTVVPLAGVFLRVLWRRWRSAPRG